MMSSISTTDTGLKKKKGIRIKNLMTRLSTILLGLIIIAGGFAFNVITKDQSILDPLSMSDKEIRQMLLKDTKRINLFIESIQKIPNEIATILGLQKLNRKEIKIVMESILLNNPELFGTAVAYEPYSSTENKLYSSYYLYRKDKGLHFITLNDPEYDYFNKEWYLMPKIFNQPIWVKPFYDDGGGGVFMTTYSVPFYFFDGVNENLTGIVTVDVSIDWLTSHFTADTKIPNNGYVTLISEHGVILSTSNKDWLFNDTIFTEAESLNIPELREIGRDIQKGKSGVKRVTNSKSKKTIMVFYSVIDANKWGILYMIPDKTNE